MTMKAGQNWYDSPAVEQFQPVYRTLPMDPLDGWPLGNGEVGALLWCEESRLIAVVNRSDWWSDAPDGPFCNWRADEEERSTTLRHGCRVILDFKLPLFSPLYREKCHAEIHFSSGMLTLRLQTAFGNFELECLVPEGTDCWRARCRGDFFEGCAAELVMERFGSRTFSHWYSQVRCDPACGLEGESCSVEDGRVLICRELSDGTATAELRLPGGTAQRYNSRAGGFRLQLPASWSCEWSCALSAPGAAPRIPDESFETALKRNTEAWSAFWERSYIEGDDPYFNSLWHTGLYLLNASQRGTYPGRFIGGLWHWQRDVQPWNFYFHWNQQILYWPVDAAGHSELADSYLALRFKALPLAEEEARAAFYSPGGIVSDVTERRGYNSKNELANHTPMAQIALDFYRRYRYTGDEEFLRERAYPYLLSAARFLAGRFRRGGDGLWHGMEATAYEGWLKLVDVTSEIAELRALLPAVFEAAEILGESPEEIPLWREMLEHLAPLATIDAGSWRDRDGRLSSGMFKGTPLSGSPLLAAGFHPGDGKPQQTIEPTGITRCEALHPERFVRLAEYGRLPTEVSYADTRPVEGYFPYTELSPVFPAGVIGLGTAESGEFVSACDTARAFSLMGEAGCWGWDPVPVILARLGLGSESWTLLRRLTGWKQNFANGFFIDGDQLPASLVRMRHLVIDLPDRTPPEWEEYSRTLPRRPLNAYPFRHIGLEGNGVFCAAMNERLLQSHDGIVRIAPAVRPDETVRFRLYAVGGHRIEAAVIEGKVRAVRLTLGFSGCCCMANPWLLALAEGELHAERVLEFRGSSGTVIEISDGDAPWDGVWPLPRRKAGVCCASDGLSRIGMERDF